MCCQRIFKALSMWSTSLWKVNVTVSDHSRDAFWNRISARCILKCYMLQILDIEASVDMLLAGERLSPWVSISCVAMGCAIILGFWSFCLEKQNRWSNRVTSAAVVPSRTWCLAWNNAMRQCGNRCHQLFWVTFLQFGFRGQNTLDYSGFFRCINVMCLNFPFRDFLHLSSAHTQAGWQKMVNSYNTVGWCENGLWVIKCLCCRGETEGLADSSLWVCDSNATFSTERQGATCPDASLYGILGGKSDVIR